MLAGDKYVQLGTDRHVVRAASSPSPGRLLEMVSGTLRHQVLASRRFCDASKISGTLFNTLLVTPK